MELITQLPRLGFEQFLNQGVASRALNHQEIKMFSEYTNANVYIMLAILLGSFSVWRCSERNHTNKHSVDMPKLLNTWHSRPNRTSNACFPAPPKGWFNRVIL